MAELKAYLIDVETRERLEFQYNPSEIGDDKSANYADIAIPGISHPRQQYVSGGARRIAFKLFFFKGEVKQQVNWLQSLLYPEHSGTTLKSAPHRTIFVFGELYPGIVCIVRNVKARYFNLFDETTLSPQHAEIDLTLDEWVDESVNFDTIRA